MDWYIHIFVLLVLILIFSELIHKDPKSRLLSLFLKISRAITVIVTAIVTVAQFLSIITTPSSSTPALGPGAMHESAPVFSSEPTLPPTPEPTPRETPGIEDMRGCNAGVIAPYDDNWLSEYEFKVIRTRNGVLAYLCYRSNLETGYFDTVNEGTRVIVLARQDGSSLVKVADGVVGWVNSNLLGDN